MTRGRAAGWWTGGAYHLNFFFVCWYSNTHNFIPPFFKYRLLFEFHPPFAVVVDCVAGDISPCSTLPRTTPRTSGHASPGCRRRDAGVVWIGRRRARAAGKEQVVDRGGLRSVGKCNSLKSLLSLFIHLFNLIRDHTLFLNYRSLLRLRFKSKLSKEGTFSINSFQY